MADAVAIGIAGVVEVVRMRVLRLPSRINEDRVGDALMEIHQQSTTTRKNVFCIAKVPKRVTHSDQVRSELSVVAIW